MHSPISTKVRGISNKPCPATVLGSRPQVLPSYLAWTVPALFLILISGSASAQTTYTWTGAANTAWNNAANWSPATGYPLVADNAVIVTTANSPVLDADRTITNLTVTSGTVDLGARTLTYTGTGTFTSGAVNNGTLAPNSPAGTTTLSGTTFAAAINGTADRMLFNGSIFNAPVTVTKTGSTNDYSNGGNTFNNTLTITVTNGRQYMYNSANDTYNGNVILNSTGTSGGVWLGQNTGSATLAAGRIVSIGAGGFSIGSLLIRNFTQTGTTAQVLTLTGASTLYFQTGSTFNGNVTTTSPGLYMNGSTFQGTAKFTKTGSASEYSSAGCTFNSTTEFIVTGIGALALSNTGTDTYNGNLIVNSTSTGGIWFGATSGSSVLASGRTITVGSSGFSSGDLRLKGFIQNGATSQVFVLTGAAQLHFSAGTVFNGALTTTSPTILLNGAVFNGTTSFVKTGSANDVGSGGNVFNAIAEFTNTGTGVFNLHNTGIDQFNENVLVNNTSTGEIRFGAATGTSVLAAGRTIAVGGTGYSNGWLRIGGMLQVGATSQNITLGPLAALMFNNGSVFNGNVTALSGSLVFNGATFNGSGNFTKTGLPSDQASGGNTFNGDVEFTVTNTGILYLHNTGTDLFNGNIRVNNTSTGEIRFGNTTGTSTLAAGKTITVGGTGFNTGWLRISGMTQVGATPQNITLGTGAGLVFQNASVFNGNMTTTSGSILLNGAIFNGSGSFTKTDATSDAGAGGNTFNGNVQFINTNTGYFYLNNTGYDAFNGNVQVNSTSTGEIRFGYSTGTSTLSAGKSISVGGLGFATGWLRIGGMTQVGGTAQNIMLGTSAGLAFTGGSVFNGDVTSSSGRLTFSNAKFNSAASFTKTGTANDSGTLINTFNGNTVLTNSGTGILYMGYSGTDLFNADLALSSTNTGGIYFGTSGGTTQLATGGVLSVGPSGYTAGPLVLRNFTQIGSGMHNLVQTGSASFQFLTGTTFNGPLTVVTPSLLLNGSTFNAATSLTKNGSSANSCVGGNIFNGDLTLVNSGTGALTLASSAADDLNGNVLFRRTGTGTFVVNNNFNSTFSKNVSTVGSTGTVQFGSGAGRTIFDGTTVQQFSTDAAWPPDVRRMTLAMTGGGKLDLLGNVNVIVDLAFTTGVIRPQAATSSSNGLLILQNGITFSVPAHNGSYVDGFVRKIGNTAFDFPVGSAGVLAPIGISAPSTANHHFTAKYVAQSPHTTFNVNSKYPTLNHVSECEYWILDRTNSTTNVSVTLSWDSPRSCGVTDLSELAVARWNGTQWMDHGNGGTTGNITSGTVTSSATVSLFATPSPFTLASTGIGNPLPIELVRFNAISGGTKVRTEWATASEVNNDRFEVESSADGVLFKLVGTVPGAGSSQGMRNYELVDTSPRDGSSYYRLKQIDLDGTYTYSQVVPVFMEIHAESLFSVFPNPTSGDATIALRGIQEGRLVLAVHNSMGQLVMDISHSRTSGDQFVPVSLEGLSPGVYIVHMEQEGGLINEVRLLRQ